MAVVLDVPVEVCDTCQEVWLDLEVAERVDRLFTMMLSCGTEVAARRYDAAPVTMIHGVSGKLVE